MCIWACMSNIHDDSLKNVSSGRCIRACKFYTTIHDATPRGNKHASSTLVKDGNEATALLPFSSRSAPASVQRPSKLAGDHSPPVSSLPPSFFSIPGRGADSRAAAAPLARSGGGGASHGEGRAGREGLRPPSWGGWVSSGRGPVRRWRRRGGRRPGARWRRAMGAAA